MLVVADLEWLQSHVKDVKVNQNLLHLYSYNGTIFLNQSFTK